MAERSNAEILEANRFFSGLDPEHIAFLAEQARSQRLVKDEVLFRHGDEARHFYLVLSGELSIEVAAIEGPTLELQVLDPGAVVGWSWLISPYRWRFQGPGPRCSSSTAPRSSRAAGRIRGSATSFSSASRA